MRFSKQIKPPAMGGGQLPPPHPLGILAIVFIVVGGVMVALTAFALLTRQTRADQYPATMVISLPAAAETVEPLRPTPATLAALIGASLQSVTPISSDPRPPTSTPTPALRPTGYYVAPLNPTPIPTPELPPAAPFPTSCDGPGRMNILVIGMDGRSANYDRAARADALAVIGVNFGDRSAQILSIPRDLWVQIPAYGTQPAEENRINTGYALAGSYGYPGGGAAFQAYVVSQTFGLRIDRTMVLNFTAFESAIDTIGGVDINVTTAVHDPRYPDDQGGTLVLEIPAGLVHMDGRTALMYARTRHADSDFGRMRRQQKVLMAVRDKLLTPESLLVLPSLVQLIYQSVRTDLSLDDVGLLGCVGPQIPRESITQIVIDSTMTTSFAATSGAQVLLPKMDLITPLLAAFNTGQ